MTEDSNTALTPSTPPGRRARRRNGGITLSDVAKLAGVAPITASRALNTPDAVSPKLLQRVLDAVEQVGYVPNMLAGSLASNKSRLVAAVIPTISGPIFQETVESLTSCLAQAGYQLMLGQSGYENSREDVLLEAVIGRRPDGIVLTGVMHSAASRRRLLMSGIPIVETWDLTPTPIDMLVGFSHERIGAEVAKYLHKKGRRRVACIRGNDERAARRMNAFSDASIRLGMAHKAERQIPAYVVPAPTTLGCGRKGLNELLAAHPDIDAIFCSSDLIAIGLQIEAQLKGISIPERMAVVGFGDREFAQDLASALTTVRIDGIGIGATSAQLLIDRAEGRQVEQPVCDMGFSIIERDSA